MNPNSTIYRITVGLVAGALFGLVIGYYLFAFSFHLVFDREDYSSIVSYLDNIRQYRNKLLVLSSTSFSVICAVLSAVCSGPWLRHSLYGLTAAVLLVVSATLVAAQVTDQQPINMSKGSESTYMDFALAYGIPTAFLIGPTLGLLIGRSLAIRSIQKATEIAEGKETN